MAKQEVSAEVRQARKKRRKIIGLIILGCILVLAIVFHKDIYYTARSAWGTYQLNKSDRKLEYKEVTLTKEQMLEDFDYLFDVAVNTSLSKEYAEKYYNVDYNKIYNTYKERIQNCKDEFEFTALMISLNAKLPGAHGNLIAPQESLGHIFPTAEIFDSDTIPVNYSLSRQFEDRMGEFDQKGIIAIYKDGDYVLFNYSFSDFETIDDLADTKLLSLNGKPVKDIITDIDTMQHLKYDTSNGSAFVSEFTLNDGIGEKYDAEIMFKDGTVIHRDLYVSPEYTMSYYYRSEYYPERYKKEKASAGTSGEDNTSSRSYTITTDAERKLLYANFSACLGSETEQVKEDLKQALGSADIENVILDFRNNGGGACNFVTEGVLPAVLDHDAGHINGEIYPVNEYTKNFCENIVYSAKLKIKKSGDKYYSEEDFTVKGEAARAYNIYALVNHSSFSSADIFAYVAKNGGVTLIGQNTGGDGLTGNPLQSYLPNSKLQFTFVCSTSEICPEDGYEGVTPDYYVKEDWEVYLKRRELASSMENANLGTYENRQKWDAYLLKALELIDNR